jgi:hypothetical protein
VVSHAPAVLSPGKIPPSPTEEAPIPTAYFLDPTWRSGEEKILDLIETRNLTARILHGYKLKFLYSIRTQNTQNYRFDKETPVKTLIIFMGVLNII